MQKYTTKPNVVEAFQWTGNQDYVNNIFGETDSPLTANHAFVDNVLHVRSGFGVVKAQIGEYLVKNDDGTFTVFSTEDFENRYQPLIEFSPDSENVELSDTPV